MSIKGVKDYFKILGISRNSTDQEIKSAFKKLAKKFHPDLHPNDENAESAFKEINEAYEILSNQELRKFYEKYLSHEFTKRDRKPRDFNSVNNDKDFENFFNFGDFGSDVIERFSDLGQEFYSNISSEYDLKLLTLDAEFSLQITFFEAFNGTKKIF